MSIKRQVINGVKWTTVSTIVSATTAILKISILTRLLEKTDFGLIALATFIMGFMELFNDMGLTSAILHKQDINRYQYASLYWFNLMLGFTLYAFLIALAPLIAGLYHQNLLNHIIPLLGLNLIFSSIGNQFKLIEQKKLLFKQISILDITASICSLIIAILLAMNGYGVFSLIYSMVIQSFIFNIGILIIGLRKQGLLLHYKFNETKPFLKIGIYQVGGQIANYFNRDLDILLVANFFSPGILGGYSLAKQLVFRPAQLINPILVKVASPTLAVYQNNINLLKNNYLKLVNIVSSINIPVYFGIIIFAPSIIEILYGTGYDDIVILVRILSIYMIFRALGNPVGSLVVATGRTDLEFFWNLITLLIMPLFILVGVQYGIVYVAIAVTMAMVILYIPAWKFLIHKLIGATFKEYFYASFGVNIRAIYDRR